MPRPKKCLQLDYNTPPTYTPSSQVSRLKISRSHRHLDLLTNGGRFTFSHGCTAWVVCKLVLSKTKRNGDYLVYCKQLPRSNIIWSTSFLGNHDSTTKIILCFCIPASACRACKSNIILWTLWNFFWIVYIPYDHLHCLKWNIYICPHPIRI
jgi:hypothetical protein